MMDVEEMFEELCFPYPDGAGLWVYEQDAFDPNHVDSDGGWSHLADGEWRRPTLEELAPLAGDNAPWADGRLV